MYQTPLQEHAPQFPDLLRNWRKLRKLSQWDLSLNAGISQRHLSFLESGRSSPSREMVLKLADTLEIPLQEQNSLLSSAGFAPVYQAASLDDASLRQAREALEILLTHHEPYPCLVVDRCWNMLMTNEANLKLFSNFIDLVNIWDVIGDDGSRNLVKLMLHPAGLKPFVRNWEVFANYFLQGLRHDLRHNPYSVGIRDLLEEVSHYPGLPGPDPELPSPGLPFLTMELASPTLSLKLFSMVSTFGSPHDVTLQQLRIETFFPADEASGEAIRAL